MGGAGLLRLLADFADGRYGLIAAFAGVLVMPWSRSLWTMFLFVTGEMGAATVKPE